jgi:glycosyltransferase involved in cell wall biosynthesis
MNKKRVLLVSEAHYLNSGFGTYGKEILTRLAATNKYELAEFAAYGKYSAVQDTPWLFYANMPEESDPEQAKQTYNSQPTFQFGAWRFERVCLDFRPDIVLSYRDPWMDMFIRQSPFRRLFHWVWMPTVDSTPQKQEWIEAFSECDALFTYSEFGTEVLRRQGKGTVNVIGCASPGIDPKVYTPIYNKEVHRKRFGIRPDAFIVGTVMRNQRRKLFFELMHSFRLFLDKAPPEIAAKSYLYLHTSYPEKAGWHIPDGILQNKLAGKVLSTYVCRNCKKFFATYFNDAMAKCKHCGALSAVCPTVGFGLSIPDLVQVYNLFDLYAQYAICEGFGMPQVEAAACGVPVAATDYSAMSDVVRHTKGYPIRISKTFREIETNANRVYPDNEHMADVMLEFFSLTKEERASKCFDARKGAVSRYNWNDTAKEWEKYIDSYEPLAEQGDWNVPPNVYDIPPSLPPRMSHMDATRWIFSNLMHTPDEFFKREGVKLIRDLNFGAIIDQGVLEELNQDKAFESYKNRASHSVECEKFRANSEHLTVPDFITEAHSRRRTEDD